MGKIDKKEGVYMENLNKENNKIVEELNNNDRIIEEMLKERESIIIDDFKKEFNGIEQYYLVLNGISNTCMQFISINEIKEQVINEFKDIYENLEELYKDTKTRKQAKWLLENRVNDLIELETNYMINVITNKLDDELEDIDIEGILTENKTEILMKISDEKIRKIVEEEFKQITKCISAKIKSNPIRLIEVDKIIKERGKFKIYGTAIDLIRGDYKLGIIVLKNKNRMNIKNLDDAPISNLSFIKRDIIPYLLDNIIPEFVFVELELPFDYYLQDYLGDISDDIEFIVDKINRKKIWDLNNFNLDIFD